MHVQMMLLSYSLTILYDIMLCYVELSYCVLSVEVKMNMVKMKMEVKVRVKGKGKGKMKVKNPRAQTRLLLLFIVALKSILSYLSRYG
jgi:hypothetical protein